MRYEFIIQLAGFKNRVKQLGLTLDDIVAIEGAISDSAFGYPVMQGTGGLRKMQFSSESRGGGKSGGVRVCYFIVVDPAHVYLVTAFSKNEKENLNAKERSALAKVISEIRYSYRQD